MFLKRLGTTPKKFIFEIHVKKLQLPTSLKGTKIDDKVVVYFERGSKSAVTEEQLLIADPDDDDYLFAEFNQTIQLKVTLFRDSHDNYLDKTGQLTVRQRKRGAAGHNKDPKEAFKTIGTISLLLHNLCEDHNEEYDAELDFCAADEGTQLTFLVTARENFDGDADDTSTIASSVTAQKKHADKKKPKKKSVDEEDIESVAESVDNAGKNSANKRTNAKDVEAAHDDDSDQDKHVADLGDHDDDAKSEQSDYSLKRNHLREIDHYPSIGAYPAAIVPDIAIVPAAVIDSDEEDSNQNIRGNLSSPVATQSQRNVLLVVKDEVTTDTSSIQASQLSKKGLQWLNEVELLNHQNHELQEKHESMLVMAEKADVVCDDALKLEERVNATWLQVKEKRAKISSIENILVNKVADIEEVLQLVIKLKMQDVEYAMEIEGARHRCAQLHQQHAKLLIKSETTALNSNSAMSGVGFSNVANNNRGPVNGIVASNSNGAGSVSNAPTAASYTKGNSNTNTNNSLGSDYRSGNITVTAPTRDKDREVSGSTKRLDYPEHAARHSGKGASTDTRSKPANAGRGTQNTAGGDAIQGNPRSRDRVLASDMPHEPAGIVPVKRSRKPGSSISYSS